ncbi:hypothetical protein DL766_004881 [Monosporascus sp. MC13-8B]|nr:hypothetical protein DL766_004881 [Monosporascus sp. MC13-8B]
MAAKAILLLLSVMLAGLSRAATIKDSTAGGFSSSCWDVSLGPSHDSHEKFSGELRAECKESPDSKSKHGKCSKLWLGNCYANIDGKIIPEAMYRLRSEHPGFMESCKDCKLRGTFLTCSCKVGGYFGKEKKYGETTVNLDELIHNDGGYLGCYDKRGDERGCPAHRGLKVAAEEAGKYSSSKSDHTPTSKTDYHTPTKTDHHTPTSKSTSKSDHHTPTKTDHHTPTSKSDHTVKTTTTAKPSSPTKPHHSSTSSKATSTTKATSSSKEEPKHTKPGHNGKPGHTEKPGHAGPPDHTGKPDYPGKPDYTGKPDHTGKKSTSTSFITSTVTKTHATTAKPSSTSKHGY